MRHSAGLTAATIAALCVPLVSAAPQWVVIEGIIDRAVPNLEPLPASFIEGAKVYGVLRYDPELLKANEEFPNDPGRATYYTRNTAALAFWLQVGNWELASTPAPANASVYPLIIYNDTDDHDSLSVDTVNPGIWINGAPVEGGAGGFSLYLTDGTRTAFGSDALPVPFPALDAFTSGHQLGAGASSVDPVTGSLTGRYGFNADITGLTANGAPPLQIEDLRNGTLKLSWTILIPGFSLETATTPDAKSWKSLGGPVTKNPIRNEVIVPATTDPRFFRLVKP